MKIMPDPGIDELRQHPISQGLSDSECEVITSLCSREVFEDGEVLFTEQETKRDLLILKKGAIRISKTDDHGHEKELAKVEPPTVLGEIGMVLGEPRTATGRAAGQVEAIVLDGQGMQKLLADNNLAAFKAAYNAVKELAKRQNKMNSEALKHMEQLEGTTAKGQDDVSALRQKLLKEWTF